jgi:DNA-binding winged helix-turn-helix (wHTH) protein/TolB-like protein
MSRVRFGIFEFDTGAKQLRREGVLVRLQAQPGRVLAELVEHAGEVVTREQLKQAIWGSETFVDFERGLNFCIAQIRGALGDSAESPRFVRTVPKQGYQFVAPVMAIEVPKKSRTKLVWAAVVAIAVCGLAVSVFALRRPGANIAILRFDNETGNAEMDRFADGLTDSVVAELTAVEGSRYGIIGNAAILRQPRSGRDLKAIGSALGARYVIMGQVQRDAARTRVLAHLIRLPEQTHLWVVRVDRDVVDPLPTENELSRLIVSEFSRKLAGLPVVATR